MFRLMKSALHTAVRVPVKSTIAKREFTRNFIYLCRTEDSNSIANKFAATAALHKPSITCTCGCGIRGVHSKSERELVEFLTEEITAERKAQKIKTIPADLDGFQVKLDGAEIELVKKTEKEEVRVSFNVNHTVDTEGDAEAGGGGGSNTSADKQEDFGEMKSKPTFEVDIVRGNQTLSFTCSFLHDVPQEGDYNDVFGIDEVTLFQGEHKDSTYAVAGDVLDGYLYDLLMNLLEEKGVSNEFAEKLSDFSTNYEHFAYIGLLEGLSKFTIGKP